MIRVAVCLPQDEAAWVAELQAALGAEFQVEPWRPGAAPVELALAWKPPQAFLDAQPGLRLLFAAGAGVDGLLALRLPAGAQLVRLEDAGMGQQMAEYVLHALLRWYRGFDRYAAQAAQALWRPLPPEDKADWRVGLLGYGALARPVAAALQGLGFPLRAWTRGPKDAPGISLFHGAPQLPEFLAGCRVLVALLPLTAQTRGLLDAAAFACLPQGAYLINVARGGLVDEAALLAALDQGRLAGAALDVCQTEPAPPEHPFWRHPRIQLTPHVAAATLRREAVAQIVAKLQAWRGGAAIGGVVGPEGY